MKTRNCCAASRPTTAGRLLGAAGWVLPSVILALLPKCPVCVAGYVALATGIGISISTASHLRASVLVVCMIALGLAAAALLWRLVAAIRTSRA